MNQRTPAQEATIEAAIAHVDFLLQAHRGAQHYGESYKAAIRLAIVAAATAIVEEPRGQERRPPVRALRLVKSTGRA